jgi:hypothetical protein
MNALLSRCVTRAETGSLCRTSASHHGDDAGNHTNGLQR